MYSKSFGRSPVLMVAITLRRFVSMRADGRSRDDGACDGA
jgi:hypothetical protein